MCDWVSEWLNAHICVNVWLIEWVNAGQLGFPTGIAEVVLGDVGLRINLGSRMRCERWMNICAEWARCDGVCCLLVQWCSGYHVRLTRGRSPVRARAEPAFSHTHSYPNQIHPNPSKSIHQYNLQCVTSDHSPSMLNRTKSPHTIIVLNQLIRSRVNNTHEWTWSRQAKVRLCRPRFDSMFPRFPIQPIDGRSFTPQSPIDLTWIEMSRE